MMLISAQSSNSTVAPTGGRRQQMSPVYFLLRIAFAVCFFCFAFSGARAQNIQFTQGSVGSSLDNTLQIPLRSYPGRGSASLPISLYYSSKVWRISHLKTISNNGYLPITEAIYAEHSTAGWKTSLDIPKVEWPKADDTYLYTGKPSCPICTGNLFRVSRVYIHMPDGSTHELRESDQPYPSNLGVDMVGTFYAVDGSRLRYDSTGSNTGTLYMRDGSRYLLGGGTAQFIDRNGNTLNYNASTRQWTDTLGRVIGIPLPSRPLAQDYSYTLPGIGGSTMPYTFRWRYLADALTPGQNGQSPARKPIANEYLPNPHLPPTPPSGGNYPILVQQQYSDRPSLFISDGDADGEGYATVVGHCQDGGELFNPVVLTEIVLPNGLSYKFSYNIYGEIDKVIYPTGAFERYTYGELPGIGDIKPPYVQANRGVTKRELSADGTGNDLATWQYTVASIYEDNSVPLNTLRIRTKAPAPDNTWTESYKHNFKAPQQPGRTNPRYWPFGFEDATNGMVFDERVYAPNPDGTQGPMLRRKLTKWDRTEQDVAHRTSIPGDDIEKAYRNARPAKEVSIILDTDGEALAKTLTYQYDATYQLSTGLDLLVSTESHFAGVVQTTAQGGAIDAIPPVLPASTVETVYLSDPNYRSRNILGLPTSVILKDANGQIVSKSETFYDEASYFVSAAGQPTGWADPGTTVRGNATTSRRYFSLNPQLYLESHVSYDRWGNVRSTWNERGNQSQVDYTDSFSDGINRNTFAYPTNTTSPIPDPTGAHGSNSALLNASKYDFSTGLVTSTTDANLQPTSFSYSNEQNSPDPLSRLRKIVRPDGSWTMYEFNDALGNLYTLTQTQLDATRSTKAYQFFDALGRQSRSFALEGGTSYIVSDVQYDKLGRVWRTSNPYRTQGLNAAVNPSNLWTTTSYDALGRVKSVTLPDSTTVQSSYQGIYTTVQDQAGKQRRQKVDALGRVVRVDEPDSSGNLGTVTAPVQPTLYVYDTQGNLIHVAQGITQPGLNPEDPNSYLQHRYFKYDSLSRLTYERQVEQTAIFTASDPLTGNNQWSRKVLYDESGYQGLVTSMRDARNVLTQYQYDNLNRVYQVSYSDGTPTLTNLYDQARTGYLNKGRLTEVRTAAAAAAGQMPAIPATSQVYDYDLMGRVIRQQQTVDSNTYTLAYAYNQGGQLISETYPSGRVVNYSFDNAARLNGVTSGATTYASQFDYGSPQGLLKTVALGNGAVQSYDYNDRLQLKTLSLTKDSNVLQKYEYRYGRINADGTVDETKNNGQLGRIEGFIGTVKQWQQRFIYDSLGRLAQASEHRGDNSQQSYLINYAYDQFGNRYQPAASNTNSLAYVAVEDSHINQSTNRSASNVTYDAAGNITVNNKFRQLLGSIGFNLPNQVLSPRLKFLIFCLCSDSWPKHQISLDKFHLCHRVLHVCRARRRIPL
jgi:YD repeat-containing protein